MTFDPITGNEVQIEGFQQPVIEVEHGQTLEDVIVETTATVRERLQAIFNGEHGHKIVRVHTGYGHKSFLVNAGFEEQMYNDITDYVGKMIKKHGIPVNFVFTNFLSYSPLRRVTNDNDE
jgi:hypothetical protein